MISAKEIFWLNEQGKRQNNEDNIYPLKGTATAKDDLFIVCDGVGGENKGEVASEIVCRSIHHFFSKQRPAPGNEREAIERSIGYANSMLAEHAATDNTARRMSTTMSLVYLGKQSILAAWCGDTRIHHIREGKVIWKSDDHSLVHELVKSGEITEEDARCHPKRNIITRSLNAGNNNNVVDFHEITDFKSGDYLLLCTDGLLEQINDDRLFSILSDEGEGDKARHFLSYCQGKTRDNFSMYLVQLGNHVNGAGAVKKKARTPAFRPLLISSILLLCLATILVMYFNLKENEVVSQEGLTGKSSGKNGPLSDSAFHLNPGSNKIQTGQKLQ